jgi:NAD(P)-dependent dehydrogenase (short-subunit alcohol dehydrogenase family)
VYRRGRVSRTVVVTGSASGLGGAIRRHLEGNGCRVVGIDLQDAEIQADLGTPQGRVSAMNAVLDLTKRTIDGLVLMAGLGADEAPVPRLLAVNYYGAVEVLDGLRPGLAAGAHPAAVTVVPNAVGFSPPRDSALADALLDGGEAAAVAAAEGLDAEDAYLLAKATLARAVRTRSLEWGRSGIRLNVVARGPFPAPPRRTEGDGRIAEALPVPLERAVGPDDVARVVGFLLGPDAAVVHGSVLYVDGGTDALLRPDHV